MRALRLAVLPASLRPSTQFDFSHDFDARMTYSCTSAMGRYDKAGLYTGDRGNALPYSADFSQWLNGGIKAWGSGSTVNATTAPDGSTTADLITEDTSSGEHGVSWNSTLIATSGVFSVYVKANGRTRIELVSYGGYISVARGFNLSNGTTADPVASATEYTGGVIEDVGNGWYRCAIRIYCWCDVRIRLHNGSAINYTGDNSSGVYLWGAQVDGGHVMPDAYTPTSGSSVYLPSLDYEPVTHQPRGVLVGEQRTNLNSYANGCASGDGWSGTANSYSALTTDTLDPEGRNTATKVTPDTASSVKQNAKGITCTAVDHVFSFYAKSNGYYKVGFKEGTVSGAAGVYDLSTGTLIGANNGCGIEAVGNGWYRCWRVWTAAAQSLNMVLVILPNSYTTGDVQSQPFVGDGTSGTFFWGIQLEVGDRPSPYIPTKDGTATRAAANWYIRDDALNSWFNAAEGTLIAETTSPHGVNPSGGIYEEGGPIHVLHEQPITRNHGFYLRYRGRDGHFSQGMPVAGTETTNASYRDIGTTNSAATNVTAQAWKSNGLAFAYNGTVNGIDMGAYPPFGCNSLGSAHQANVLAVSGSGSIRRLHYYRQCLPNHLLEQLTRK